LPVVRCSFAIKIEQHCSYGPLRFPPSFLNNQPSSHKPSLAIRNNASDNSSSHSTCVFKPLFLLPSLYTSPPPSPFPLQSQMPTLLPSTTTSVSLSVITMINVDLHNHPPRHHLLQTAPPKNPSPRISAPLDRHIAAAVLAQDKSAAQRARRAARRRLFVASIPMECRFALARLTLPAQLR